MNCFGHAFVNDLRTRIYIESESFRSFFVVI